MSMCDMTSLYNKPQSRISLDIINHLWTIW